MAGNGFILDKNLKIRRATRTVWNVLKSALKYLVATVSLAVFYYIVFALVISTDSERAIRRENRMYERTYADMIRRERLLASNVRNLQLKDGEIYEELFHAQAPALDPLSADEYPSGIDTIPDKKMVEYAAAKVAAACADASRIEANFRKALALAASMEGALPPMTLPLASISSAQVGASVGTKVNPFYKVGSTHSGLDLIALQGEPVLAAADGTVTAVIRSHKGQGNVVEITHAGGYVTRYAHLADLAVSRGQKVERGRRIANVGISGSSFAPHLHYEVLRDGVSLDPTDCLFASVGPQEYAQVKYMASRTGQSLD